MDLRSTLLVIGGSACSFKLLNTTVRFLPTPEPESLEVEEYQHFFSSQLADRSMGCFMMVEDLISSHSLLSHSLVAVSSGYFIHDFMDLTLNQSFKRSWEVLLHHSVVLSCFSLAVTSRHYLGFAVVSLLLEVNSVFLHIRQLLLLSGKRSRSGTEITTPRPSATYRMTSWLNLGTFLVFRVCTLGWMSHWLAGHSDRVPRYILLMGTAGLGLISTMSMVLFYRLLRADILKQ